MFKVIISNLQKVSEEFFGFLEVDNSFTPNTSKKANVSGTPSGLMGWVLKKMRYYNLMPKFAISDYLPKFIMELIFKSVYKPTEKLNEDSRRDITELTRCRLTSRFICVKSCNEKVNLRLNAGNS